MVVKGNMLFVTHAHSEKVEAFRINQNPADHSQILTETGIELTGGITPQGVEVSADGSRLFVANMQTEDVSILSVDAEGRLQRQGYLAVGVTPSTPDPTKRGGNGQGLFATDEEAGLRWFFSDAYSDDNQKSCGFCHWDGRQDGCQWNVAANAVGGVKVCPQNKDISDNWPEWYEGLNNDMMAYASACNGEVLLGESNQTPLFPQASAEDRARAREEYVLRKTEENSAAIGRPELNGKARKVGYYDLAYLQILWSQNETRQLPNPLNQFPDAGTAAQVARGKQLFTNSVAAGGAGCAECHHNGNKFTNGALDDTFQDFNIHEPGVISETTVDGDGPFFRPGNDYFFERFGPPQDVGIPQNLSSRNTKHLRTWWDSVPKWLHHGFAHTAREILLAPDSPLLLPGERGFNFRTVRADHRRGANNLPTEVPVTFGDSRGGLAGDGNGPIYVSLDSPVVLQNGKPQIDRLGTSNVLPLVTGGQINPALAANNVQVIKDTHGKTSHLSATDFEALVTYLKSLSSRTVSTSGNPTPTATPTPTPTATPAPTATPSPSATPSPTVTPSPTATATPTPKGSPTPSPSATPSPSPSGTPTPSPSATPTPTPSSRRNAVRFSASNFNVSEGAGSALVTVTRTGDTTDSATVEVSTIDRSSVLVRCDNNTGVASSRCDFATTIETLSFAPGETEKSVVVPVFDDAHQENAETLAVKLSNASGASLDTQADASVTIADNDAARPSANPLDGDAFFVNMHYIDFLSREPEPAGFAAWTGVLGGCINHAAECDRITVSSAFFRSQEFQLKGFFVYRFYKVAFGRLPLYAEIIPDMRRVTGQTAEEVAAKKDAFTADFMERAEFRGRFGGTTGELFVDRLAETAGVALPNRSELVAALNSGAKGRAQVLREIVESAEVGRREYNSAFVAMQYFGYLRRDPDADGFNAWLRVLDADPQDYRTMVRGFESSVEYRLRFGQP
jgi:hypothetical protein